METVIPLFAFATFWYWTLVVLASIFIWIALENEKGWLATFTVAAFLAVIHFWGGIRVIDYMKAHPIRVFGGIGGYFVTGAVWSIIKWWFYVRKERDRCREALNAFEKDWLLPGAVLSSGTPHSVIDLFWKGEEDAPRARSVEVLTTGFEEAKKDPDFKKKVWACYLDDGTYKEYGFEYKPNPRRYKGRITTWMTYWPWSLVWTMINDPIRKAFNMIFRKLSTVFSGISEGAFKGMDVK